MAPFTVYDPNSLSPSALVNALLASNSGIIFDPLSVVLHASGTGAVTLYDASVGAPLGLGAGVLLTSGTTPGTSNTLTWFGADNSGSSGFYNGDADVDIVVEEPPGTVCSLGSPRSTSAVPSSLGGRVTAVYNLLSPPPHCRIMATVRRAARSESAGMAWRSAQGTLAMRVSGGVCC